MLSEEKLSKIIGDIADNYEQENFIYNRKRASAPKSRCSYTHYHGGCARILMFPGYFDKEHLERTIPEYCFRTQHYPDL